MPSVLDAKNKGHWADKCRGGKPPSNIAKNGETSLRSSGKHKQYKQSLSYKGKTYCIELGDEGAPCDEVFVQTVNTKDEQHIIEAYT